MSERESILSWITEYSPYALVSKDDPAICLIYNSPPAIGHPQKNPTHTSNFGLMLQEKCKDIGVDCEFIYETAVKSSTISTEYLIQKLKQ